MADIDNPPADPLGALPRGTRLAEFELRRVLGMGGFGIVYLAFDHALEREVAVKEYMPSSLVRRDGALAVSLLSQASAEPFSMGLRSFVNESRLLARFDHPSLVKVHRYWEANNTAYMAMPYYSGSNLHAVRRRSGQPPDEAWLRGVLEPLLGALDRLHGEAIYHRDISPDNVILQPDGRPVLLDFGAARRVLGDKSMALTAILKPAYAPIEQYAEAGAVKQGPWTDLYSLGATLHFLLLGRAPLPATARTVVDEMPRLADQAAQLPGCTVGFLQCVDWMLQPRPADRPQHVAALRERLARLPPAPLAAAAVGGEDWPRTQWLGDPAASHAPTVLDPSLVPATVLAPPSPDTRPTVLMPRDDPAPHDATVAMTRSGDPSLASGVAAPAPPRAAPAPARLAGAAAAAAFAGRTEPTLADDPARVADDDRPQNPNPNLIPNLPKRSATPRWPLAVGALGVAALALWLGLRPAADPAVVAASAASAPAAASAASAASRTAAAASADASADAPPSPTGAADEAAMAPPGSAAAASGIAVATGALPDSAGASAASTRPTPPAASPVGPAATTPMVAARTASQAGKLPSAGLRNERAAVAGTAPGLPTSTSPPPAGPAGLATSITRLPPADAPPAAAPLAVPASAALPTRMPLTAAAAGADTARPTVAMPGGATPSALSAAAPAVKATAVPPPRTADRDAEPVLLQTRTLSPTERCEGRVLVALWSCIERTCKAEPALRDHPDCVKSRREADQRPPPSR